MMALIKRMRLGTDVCFGSRTWDPRPRYASLLQAECLLLRNGSRHLVPEVGAKPHSGLGPDLGRDGQQGTH